MVTAAASLDLSLFRIDGRRGSCAHSVCARYCRNSTTNDMTAQLGLVTPLAQLCAS